MTTVINLPENFIGKEDAVKLESFGGHTLSLGRATRWHWHKDEAGADVFEIYLGGENEALAAQITRDRERHAFCARDGSGKRIADGRLEHVLAELEAHFARLHGEFPEPPT